VAVQCESLVKEVLGPIFLNDVLGHLRQAKICIAESGATACDLDFDSVDASRPTAANYVQPLQPQPMLYCIAFHINTTAQCSLFATCICNCVRFVV